MRRTASAFLAAFAGLCIALPAHATVLNPGDSGITADGTVTASGTQLATVTYNAYGTQSGKKLNITVVEKVIKDSGTGHLDFVYQVTNNNTAVGGNPKSNTIIEHINASDFGGQFTNVGYLPGTGSLPPALMDRSGDGTVVTWDFTGSSSKNIQPGQSSDVLVIKTNVNYYQLLGSVTVQDGAVVSVNGFQPSPEPSTMALAGLGALGLVGYGLRRRKARTA